MKRQKSYRPALAEGKTWREEALLPFAAWIDLSIGAPYPQS
jgi:hypothetical protein